VKTDAQPMLKGPSMDHMEDGARSTSATTASSAETPDLSALDLVDDDTEDLPADDTPEAAAEAGMSESGPPTDDGFGDVEFVENEAGVTS
jgi:hypothetical protein